MNQRASIKLLFVLLLPIVGCSPPLLTTPARFLELEPAQRADYDYRATSADGVVIGARVLEFDRERGGGLDFWVDAVKLRLAAMGGYALLAEKPIKTARGLAGKQLRFGRDEKQVPYQYWVTLFIDGDDVVVVEAGGPEQKLKAHEASLEKAFASVQP